MSEDNQEYMCLINREKQYSIWFAWKDIPKGWKQVGPIGSKDEVLQYVKEVWKDMRPKNLRDQMNKILL